MDGKGFMVEFNKIFGREGVTANGGVFVKRPQVCCMSAHTAEQIRQEAFEAGMDDYLTKPTSKDDMETYLRHRNVL